VVGTLFFKDTADRNIYQCTIHQIISVLEKDEHDWWFQ
jgi:hypothetical protein